MKDPGGPHLWVPPTWAWISGKEWGWRKIRRYESQLRTREAGSGNCRIDFCKRKQSFFFFFFLLLSEPTLILYHEVKGNSGSDTQVSQYDGYHGYGAFVSWWNIFLDAGLLIFPQDFICFRISLSVESLLAHVWVFSVFFVFLLLNWFSHTFQLGSHLRTLILLCKIDLFVPELLQGQLTFLCSAFE